MRKYRTTVILAALFVGGCATTRPSFDVNEQATFTNPVLCSEGGLRGSVGIPLTESEQVQIGCILHSEPSGRMVRLKDGRSGRVLEITVLETDERKCRTFTVVRPDPFEKVERVACHKKAGEWYVQPE